jgi:uncharacterized protein YbjT (DUF2867 family)
MNKVLVLGGSGFVGRHLCEKLTRLTCQVTVPTRQLGNAKPLQVMPQVTLLAANIHDEAALTGLLKGHDAVVNLVAILHGTPAAFERAHVQLPQTLARTCLAAGVKRVVHVSALGAASDAPSIYQRSKASGEQVLRSSGLDVTVLRPSVIFGAEDKFLNLFAKLQRVFPVMPLAGAGTRFQPVWVEDVASAIVRCLQDNHTVGQTFDICGPEVLTLKQLVQLAARASGVNHGHGRPVLSLPMALGRLQAALMALAPGEPLMSRDNLDSMTVDNVSDGHLPGLSALGIQAASLAAIAPTYLSRFSQHSEYQGLRAVSGR